MGVWMGDRYMGLSTQIQSKIDHNCMMNRNLRGRRYNKHIYHW